MSTALSSPAGRAYRDSHRFLRYLTHNGKMPTSPGQSTGKGQFRAPLSPIRQCEAGVLGIDPPGFQLEARFSPTHRPHWPWLPSSLKREWTEFAGKLAKIVLQQRFNLRFDDIRVFESHDSIPQYSLAVVQERGW